MYIDKLIKIIITLDQVVLMSQNIFVIGSFLRVDDFTGTDVNGYRFRLLLKTFQILLHKILHLIDIHGWGHVLRLSDLHEDTHYVSRQWSPSARPAVPPEAMFGLRYFEKLGADGRKHQKSQNNDHHRPGLWVGRLDQLKDYRVQSYSYYLFSITAQVGKYGSKVFEANVLEDLILCGQFKPYRCHFVINVFTMWKVNSPSIDAKNFIQQSFVSDRWQKTWTEVIITVHDNKMIQLGVPSFCWCAKWMFYWSLDYFILSVL